MTPNPKNKKINENTLKKASELLAKTEFRNLPSDFNKIHKLTKEYHFTYRLACKAVGNGWKVPKFQRALKATNSLRDIGVNGRPPSLNQDEMKILELEIKNDPKKSTPKFFTEMVFPPEFVIF